VAAITVVGTGYVGLTTGTCFAHLGHSVNCVDTDRSKVARLQVGDVPIVEVGLDELVAEGLSSGRLTFTTDTHGAVSDAEFVFLCLPTPDLPDGTVDVRLIDEVASQIGPWLRSGATVVNKSTVPVGTTVRVAQLLARNDVSVVSNPEFLREGHAVSDFLRPSRVVVGGDNKAAVEAVGALYEGTGSPVVTCDAVSAETIKYAANAFLATKISFINSIANICEHLGADVRVVADAIGRDPRIGSQFLQPGPGFGGSCFPKDTIGLVKLAEAAGYDFGVLKSVIEANEQQLERTTNKIVELAGGSVRDVRIAVWGLTFKANTDDRRHSPALDICRRLIDMGAQVVAFDPTVTGEVTEVRGLGIAREPLAACEGAAVLAVLTEWPEFGGVSAAEVGSVMIAKAVVDARNVLDQAGWIAAGFKFKGIGY
jgi:UDPglucose 6-dehydrogenase